MRRKRPPAATFHTSDGTRLAYRVDGPVGAPGVVLCDGISCDGYVWPYLRDELVRSHRILHVHYRGHGRSGLPRQPEAVSLADLARDLVEVSDYVGLGPATFIGHSMGVQCILEVAARYPRHLRAAVLLCGSHGRALDTFQDSDLGARLLPWIKAFFLGNVGPIGRAWRALMPTGVAYQVALRTELDADRIQRADFEPYLEHFAKMPPDLFIRMLEDAAERTSEAYLRRIRQPVLVVAADNDGFTPPRCAASLAARLPDAELHVIQGASHSAPIEVPQLLGEMLRRFMLRHGLSSACPPPAPPEVTLAEGFRAAALGRALEGPSKNG